MNSLQTSSIHKITKLSFTAEVEWNVDGNDIYKKIKDFDFIGNPLVIGSTWEKKVARELGAHFVNVSLKNYGLLLQEAHFFSQI